MNNSKDIAFKINKELLDNPLIIEYKELEGAIKSNEQLSKQEQRIKDLQKQIVNIKANGDDASEIINIYNQELASFNNHPLVVNYLNTKEEVNNLLQQINQHINDSLLKGVD